MPGIPDAFERFVEVSRNAPIAGNGLVGSVGGGRALVVHRSCDDPRALKRSHSLDGSQGGAGFSHPAKAAR
jgi:hypothetical protein